MCGNFTKFPCSIVDQLLIAEPNLQVESISNGDKREDGEEAAAATVIIGDDAMAVLAHQEQEAAQQCVVQYNTPKMELLRKIWFDASSAGIMDYPVFCRDGVAFSNRLVLASLSPWIRSVSKPPIVQGNTDSMS